MTEWISVKEKRPDDGDIVRIKMRILFDSEKECMFLKKYFIYEGENITRWVTHWIPLPEKPK